MISGACHCGAVSYTFNDTPKSATLCNCSICRRLGALWIYSTSANISLTGAGNSLAYAHGDRNIAFHSCKTCGCTTHWKGLNADEPDAYMAVNLRLAEPEVIATVPVRHFDGADTWAFID